MPPEHHQILSMETVVLKVNVNCHGCHRKVKKILNKIEGVYAIRIDAEQQMVIVKGNVDSTTLIKKLARSGKHAELWFPKSQADMNQNQEQFSQGKHKNKPLRQYRNNGMVSVDQLMYPNLLDGGSVGSDWGFEGLSDQDMAMALMPDERGNLYMGQGNMINRNGNHQNDIDAMNSMIGNHGHHDHHGYNIAAERSRLQNYPVGSGGYGYQQQPSPLMVENILASQYNQNPYGGWLRANPHNVQAVPNNNNMMHDGYMPMYHHY